MGVTGKKTSIGRPRRMCFSVSFWISTRKDVLSFFKQFKSSLQPVFFWNNLPQVRASSSDLFIFRKVQRIYIIIHITHLNSIQHWQGEWVALNDSAMEQSSAGWGDEVSTDGATASTLAKQRDLTMSKIFPLAIRTRTLLGSPPN